MGRSSGPRAGNKRTRYDEGTLSGFLGEGEVSARPAGSRKLQKRQASTRSPGSLTIPTLRSSK